MPSCKYHLLRPSLRARLKVGKNTDGPEKWLLRNGFWEMVFEKWIWGRSKRNYHKCYTKGVEVNENLEKNICATGTIHVMVTIDKQNM